MYSDMKKSGYNRETYDDKMILIELICNKQTKMILNDPTSYDSSFLQKIRRIEGENKRCKLGNPYK